MAQDTITRSAGVYTIGWQQKAAECPASRASQYLSGPLFQGYLDILEQGFPLVFVTALKRRLYPFPG